VKTVFMPTVHTLLSVLREKLNGSGMPPRYSLLTDVLKEQWVPSNLHGVTTQKTIVHS
jgi:uncharacterized membrane protein YesL